MKLLQPGNLCPRRVVLLSIGNDHRQKRKILLNGHKDKDHRIHYYKKEIQDPDLQSLSQLELMIIVRKQTSCSKKQEKKQ